MDSIEQNPLQPPTGFKLLPGEHLLLPVITHDIREFEQPPSSLEQILRLTRSGHPDEIGKNGPSIAALAFDKTVATNQTAEVPSHLRLYEIFFGRDGLRVAIDLITSYPELARATTLKLA
ncbi:MAG: hypothetical protein ABWX90_04265, partial [Candidatus Saccharimonadales bacterium]